MKRKTTFILSLTLVFAVVLSLFAQSGYNTAYAADGDFADSYYCTTYNHPSSIVAAPTVVYDLKDAAGLEALKTAEKKPSNVMLTLDENCQVVTDSGEVIDTFDNVYRKVLKKDMIPVVKVYTQGAADAFVTYVNDLTAFNDVAVMSNDKTILKSVRTRLVYVRGIYENPTGQVDLYTLVKDATEAMASTVVIPKILATTANVSYLQGMFKTVWAKWTGESKIDLSDVIFSGAYGVVTTDYNGVYDYFDEITAAAGEKKVYTRTPFIVGHRGDSENCHENSVSGILAAIEGGATHVEIDVHVTADNQLVVMHDDTIDATTNGSGTIKNMTLAAIQNYKLSKNGLEDEEIPVFKDIVMAMLESGNDDTVLIVELKCSGTQVVNVIEEVLESDEDLKPILDRMVFITFYADQLKLLINRLPYIPAAYLSQTVDLSTSISGIMRNLCEYNAVLDTSSSKVNATVNEEKLIARGVICWTWTHSTRADVDKWQDMGFIGLTTNQPTTNGKLMSAAGNREAISETPEAGTEVNLTKTTYDGQTDRIKGNIVLVEKLSDKEYKVVASYEDNGKIYYTQSFTLDYVMPSDGFPGWMLVMVIVIIVAAVVAVILINKYKNKN